MPHYLSYDKASGAVTGYVKTSAEEIHPMPRTDEEAYLKVTAPEHIELISKLNPQSARLQARIDGNELRSLKLEPAFSGSIVLSCDKEDLDGDGIAELPADGTSVARIRVQLVDDDKKPVEVDGLAVDFRVTRGSLSQRRQIVQGSETEVELRSAGETVRSQVTATADGFQAGVLPLEFVPGDELQRLRAAARKNA
jgi:hypothetical protein